MASVELAAGRETEASPCCDQTQCSSSSTRCSSRCSSGELAPLNSGSSGSLDLEPRASQKLRALPSIRALKSFSGLSSPPDAMQAGEVDQIDDFWSYSRSASKRNIAFALLLHYGGARGALAGCMAACASALPLSMYAVHRQVAALMVMMCGMSACLTVMAMAPCWRKVFLDTACISQSDEHAKRLGILSLGYNVKNSLNLLALWDESYTERMWCIFEIAACLKLKRDGMGTIPPPVRILPTSESTLTIASFVVMVIACSLGSLAELAASACCSQFMQQWQWIAGAVAPCIAPCVASAMIAKTCRANWAASSEQQLQLSCFSIANSKCFCCTCGHIHPETNEKLECDRVLIEETLVQWFGSKQAFDQAFRTELKQPQQWALRKSLLHGVGAIALPFMWHMLGYWASHAA